VSTGACLQWQIGGVRVTRVEESITPIPGGYLITGLTDDHVAAQQPWIGPYFAADGAMLLSLHSFIVESQGTTIVIDTCAGLHDDRPLPGDPTFLDRLAAEIDGGVDGVDAVVCTHLHFDHIGWNTIPDGSGGRVPAFPSARYLLSNVELAGLDEIEHDLADASIRPLLAAGLIDGVAVDHRLTGEVRLVSTPGHTRGHVSVLIESEGASALITGDATHSPIQFAHPELPAGRVDHDSDESTRTRRALIERYLDSDTLVLGTHFAPPTAGVLRSNPAGAARFVDPTIEASIASAALG
jgi:glyoxylase-like metal-dependent hydrolase (beta-lactamase superfamily II)